MQAPRVILGGETFTLPPVYFDKLLACADLIDQLPGETRRLKSSNLLLQITAVLIEQDAKSLAGRCTLPEVEALASQWREIMEWTGLVQAADPGEATATSSTPSASTT